MIGYAVFIPVFFVSIGLEKTVNGMLSIVVLIIIAVVSKLLSVYSGDPVYNIIFAVFIEVLYEKNLSLSSYKRKAPKPMW